MWAWSPSWREHGGGVEVADHRAANLVGGGVVVEEVGARQVERPTGGGPRGGGRCWCPASPTARSQGAGRRDAGSRSARRESREHTRDAGAGRHREGSAGGGALVGSAVDERLRHPRGSVGVPGVQVPLECRVDGHDRSFAPPGPPDQAGATGSAPDREGSPVRLLRKEAQA